MKALVTLGIALLAHTIVGCSSDSSSSNPTTQDRGTFNTPQGLITVTHNASIELRWDAANTEDGFLGYDVFMIADKTVADLDSTLAPAYPKNLPATLAEGAQIPRCADNTKLFEAFGFPASTADCTGDAATGTSSGTGTSASFGATFVTAGSVSKPMDDNTSDAEALPTNLITCAENTTAGSGVSLSVTGKALTQQICTVKTLADGKTALQNGHTYTFFVVAVKGSAKDEISWTSNFVSDTPAMPVYQGDGSQASGSAVNAEFVIKAGNYTVLPIAALMTNALAGTTIKDTDLSTGQCTADTAVCTINQQNDGPTKSLPDGIYFGRLGSGSYPERVFISTPNKSDQGTIGIQARGPQVFDPKDGTFKTSIPGDMASNGTYDTAGTLYPVYGNQVFDLQITYNSATYYGKVVIGQPTLATDTDPTTDMTIPVTVIIQPKTGCASTDLTCMDYGKLSLPSVPGL